MDTKSSLMMSALPALSEHDRSLALQAIRRHCGADESLVADMLGIA